MDISALAAADAEQRLIRNLFTGYSKDGRPVINKTNSVEVKFDVAYSQLKELVVRLISDFTSVDYIYILTRSNHRLMGVL